MEEKKYLYYTHSWCGLLKVEIVKETPAFYFVGLNGYQKVSKKTLYVRSDRWSRTQYYEETPELKDKYEKKVAFEKMMSAFQNKLASLSKVTDPEIIKKVMDIELGK